MRKPLRLWPGVAAAALLLVTRYVIPVVLPAAAEIGLMAGMASALAIVVWWLFFSRAAWLERIGALIAMGVALAVARPLLDMSIIGGAMGGLMYILAIPLLCLALVAWALGTRQLSDGLRRVLLPAAMLFASGLLTLVRTDGVGGGTLFQLQWRWTPTAEDKLLAQESDDPIPPAPSPAAETPGASAAGRLEDAVPDTSVAARSDAASPAAPAPAIESRSPAHAAQWPGFRGPERNGVVQGVRIESDWSTYPPKELWRRPIGPGWSSFAVDGDLFYTQEQRGGDEIVACYRVSTGEPVWRHRDGARFYESNGGAGPRGTPTLSHGRVYALGATGILNALDARTGALIWSRNAASDTKTEVPTWGFSSSPVVAGDVVIVATSGTLAGYEATTGKPRWVGQDNGLSYSSPQLLTIDGVQQALLLSGKATSVTIDDGRVLWQHPWEGAAIVQPAVIAGGDILINSIGLAGGNGTRRLAIKHEPGGWSVEERWTSNGLKPYFNDFVIHKGHAFGFDGSILASIDLADGKRKWKGGRYGSGQLVLLADQDVLLVLSEEGELALVSATPDKFIEIARVPALEGKTWNHPVVIRDVLLVRNGEEVAAFKLSLAR
jgi:outer membrane protein assembly factor BamB